jgi:hypothetical protein
VVSPPISTSEIPATRSSTIFGSETDSVLNTSPAASATAMNRPKMIAATIGDSATSGAALRAALCFSSPGMSQR